MMRMMLWSLLASAWLTGCSSVPEAIRHAPETAVTLTEARGAPEQYRGATVRWGGTIVTVRNLKDESVIEIVSRRLESYGRPLEEDRSDGRFLATVRGFVDPAIFAAGREVTVRGTIAGSIEQSIGEHRYRFVQVAAEEAYLWPPRVEPVPYYYDPFWDPWYPWGWPYYRPYYYRPYPR